MKHLKFLTAVIAFCFILFTSCKKDPELENTIQSKQGSADRTARISAELQEKISRLSSVLSSAKSSRLKEHTSLELEHHLKYRELIRRKLQAVEPANCNDNTLLNQWLGGELSDWDRKAITNVLDFAMLDLPTYDALVFENSSANQYFGLNGEHTQALTKAFKDLKRFWNIESSNIVLAAMHGNMLTDRSKLIRTYEAVFVGDTKIAQELADIVLELVKIFPQYRNGNHPIFTFNAFALEGFSYPPYAEIPDKIIMGDGIMNAYNAIGYSDVAPQAILAHEFGHHIQFDLQLFGEVRTPEATRRTELMADAYAAYFLSHARGAAMQWKRVQQFLQVFFNIGDCSFTSDNHHGTPAQRMAAAQWAYNLANSAQKQGKILSSEEFAKLFDAQLPMLIK